MLHIRMWWSTLCSFHLLQTTSKAQIEFTFVLIQAVGTRPQVFSTHTLACNCTQMLWLHACVNNIKIDNLWPKTNYLLYFSRPARWNVCLSTIFNWKLNYYRFRAYNLLYYNIQLTLTTLVKIFILTSFRFFSRSFTPSFITWSILQASSFIEVW